MFGIRVRYLRLFHFVSVSQYSTGPARESEVYPRRPPSQMGKKRTKSPITPIRRPLPGGSAPFSAISQQRLEAEMKATLGEGRVAQGLHFRTPAP